MPKRRYSTLLGFITQLCSEIALFFLPLVLVGFSQPTLAHHSFAAEFDADTQGELSGLVTQIKFSNPHVRYWIQVQDHEGEQEWEIQAASVTSLRAQGWTENTIKVGDTVHLKGQLGRGGAKKLFIRGGVVEGGAGFGAESSVARRDPHLVYADPNKEYGRGQVNQDHPFDISGAWRNSYKFRVTVDDFEPKPTPFTEEGRRLSKSYTKYDDSALRCIAIGLPRLFGNPYNLDIYDAGDHYLFLYVEHNSPRRIWMDGRVIPDDARATSNGYSVGHWESERILVVETSHLLAGWLDGSGLPMSGEGTRTIERYVFSEDKLSVDRTMTIYDPYYTQPLVRTRGMAREDGLDVSEQESCDPTTYYRDLFEADLIEKYLEANAY